MTHRIMCGIAGIFNTDERPVAPDLLARMGAAMRHRGPDGAGQFAFPGGGLAHQRLAIIDVAAGHQPMLAPGGKTAVVFNGEIYNYLEIRQRLEARGVRFATHSDTEVLLQLYLLEGEGCLDSLNGMFAFAIWDAERKTLFAARDRLGVKPFYFTWHEGSLVFASEIKAIFASGLVAPELNQAGIEDYLAFQFCLNDRTLFRNVWKLQPGECLTANRGGLKVRAYWSLGQGGIADMGEAEAAERLAALLHDAVRLQLRADVPLGTYLSGGLDSTAVTVLAASQLGHPIHSFTGVFDGPQYDESAYARIGARRANTIHHEVRPAAAELPALLPKLVYHLDEPAAGPGLYPQYVVAREAREHVKVVLTGHGADEMFGGYARYTVAYLEQCLKGAIFETQEEGKHLVTLASLIPNLPMLQQYTPMLADFLGSGMFGSMADRYLRLVDRGRALRDLTTREFDAGDERIRHEFAGLFEGAGAKSYFNKMTFFDMRTLLPALLHVEDRVSMAVSLESRVPLLDHRIVELAAAMPPLLKFAGGQTKAIFKKAVEGVVPGEIVSRKDKMGFPFPINRWLKSDVRDFTFDVLGSERFKQRGWFDAQKVDRLLSGEGAFDRGVWGLLNLELWAVAFFDEKSYLAAPAT